MHPYSQSKLFIYKQKQQIGPFASQNPLQVQLKPMSKVEKKNMHKQFLFESNQMALNGEMQDNESDEDDGPSLLKNGTCQNIEKSYIRLSSQVDYSQVRPENVLRKSFQHVMTQFHRKQVDYSYFEEQMRSIRQVYLLFLSLIHKLKDLTVQHIENQLTVLIYEFNTRISMDNNDIASFEKCLSMVESLYDKGILSNNKNEFYSYIIQANTFLKKKQNIQKVLASLTDYNLNDDKIMFGLEY